MLKIPEKFNYATNIYLLIDWPNNLRHNLNIEHRYYFKGAGPMKKMIDIDFGSTRYDELVELRYKILLEPLGLKFLDSHRQKEMNYLHIGCIESLDDKLIGGLMLAPIDNDTVRLLQVAVETKYQHEGIGRAMVQYAEERSREAGYKKIFINARLSAIHFYEKVGFHQEGDIFEEQGLTFAKMVKVI